MKLAILGASGHGKVVADTALQAGWLEVVFFDDAWPDCRLNGAWSVVGDTARLLAGLDDFEGVIVGIGDNRCRLDKMQRLAYEGARLVNVIHPSAVVSNRARLGTGCAVFAGAVIQVDCRLGDACIINTRASIDHDCQLADAVHVSPGSSLAGLVTVGEASWIGLGASVRQLVRIGADAVVGAGAAVVDDVPDMWTVAGVPARRLER